MKRFYEEMSRRKEDFYYRMPSNPQSEQDYQVMRDRYSELVGRKAILRAPKEVRVVTIEGTYPRHLRVSYVCNGPGGESKVNSSVEYASLISGVCSLEVE